MKKFLLPLIAILIAGCAQKEQDEIFHYSVLKALDNGVLEGDMPVAELKKHGDLGLGTFNKMDGEMIVMDHAVYRISADGKVIEQGDGTPIPYSVVTFYNQEDTMSIQGEVTYPALKEFVAKNIPSPNIFYAFRIRGEFEYIKCGGANMQEKPYDKSLPEMLATRPLYESRNIKGTLVGFWCPAYIGDINTAGFHLHFLADDHSIGGHLMEFNSKSLVIGYDSKTNYRIQLPETDIFRKATFRADKVNY